MDREEAIAWLRSVGRNACETSFMGGSIRITYGEPRTTGDITAYPGAVHLYRSPIRTEVWELCDANANSGAGAVETYVDLESAVRGAHHYVERVEQARRARRDGSERSER